jgi:putative holliday junction resolvase
MRTLAIDYGRRRMGLAISDESGRLAAPLDVVQVTSPAMAARLAAEAARRQGAERLLVGLPLNMDGTFGPAAAEAAAWGRELSRAAGLPVTFVDERLSSFAAEQTLIEQKRAGRKLTRKDKRRRQDALAAADFLQAFLDGRLTAIDVASAAPANLSSDPLPPKDD